MSRLRNFQIIAGNTGIVLLILTCFFVPFSTSIMGITSTLAIVCWIFSGKMIGLPRLLVKNVSVGLALALFLLFMVGLLYTPIPLDQAFSTLKKYRELLYYGIALSLFYDNDGAAKSAEDCFLLGCVVLLLISYGIYFTIIPSERYGHSIVYHITHSYFMAFLAFCCLQRIFDIKQYRYFWVSLFAITTINVFYIAPGRTGMLVYILLIVLTLFQRLSWKKSIPSLLLLVFAVAVAFATSTNFSSRVSEAIDEMKTYKEQTDASTTSLGMRFDWWRNSISLIEQKPLFGHGTGAFQTVQGELIKDSNTMPTDNPHNEYLLISVQTGLIGLGLFLALLMAQFISSFRLAPPRKYLLQGIVIAMAGGCLMNSFLFDSLPGHFYAILSAAFASRGLQSLHLLRSR